MSSSTDDPNLIHVSDLRVIAEKLFAHLEEMGMSEISLKSDYYWSISKTHLYDHFNSPDPSLFGIGQLTDDGSDLNDLITGERDAIVTDFTDFAAILKAIGDEGYDNLPCT